MKVMIVSASFPPFGWGGAEIAAEGITQWLVEQGHEAAIYTDIAPHQLGSASGTEVPPRYAPAKNGGTHRAHEHGTQTGLKKALWHAADHKRHAGESEFARAAAEFRPDVVMVHLAPGLGLGLFEYCAARDLPVVFVVHDFWMTCLRSSMFSRAGTVCTERCWMCRWSSGRRLRALLQIPRLGFWAPSRRIVEIIQKEVGDVFRNLLVERNVVDLGDFGRVADPAPAGPVRFLYVGKVTEAKGVRFVLECLGALSAAAQFEVDIVGSGDAEDALRGHYAHDHRFHFHGARPRAEVAEFYRNASALLVPSLWFENSPLVIYQAQATGLPVVGSDSGGIPELLAGRDDSFTLPAGDRAAWTAQLGALASNPALVEHVRKFARQHANENAQALDARGRKVEALCRALIDLPSRAA